MPSRQSCSNAIGSLALRDQLFVHHVEHFEERHVGVDVLRLVRSMRPARGGILLPPDMQCEVHL